MRDGYQRRPAYIAQVFPSWLQGICCRYHGPKNRPARRYPAAV